MTITYCVLRYGEIESEQISTFYTEHELRQALDRYREMWKGRGIEYEQKGEDKYYYVWWSYEALKDDEVPKWAYTIKITYSTQK